MNRHLSIPTRISRFCAIDQAGGGAEGAGAGAAGDGGAGNAGGGAGAGAGGVDPQPWFEALGDAALKTSPVIQKFKTVEDLARGYTNLEGRYGIDPARRVDLPEDPKDEAAMGAVWNRLGRPEKPEGYKFADAIAALPANATPEQKAQREADLGLLTAYGAEAHKLGLTQGQAEGAIKFLEGRLQADQKAMEEAHAASVAQAQADLKKEWGQAYDQRTREVGNLLAKYAPDVVKAELAGEKMLDHPQLMIFLGNLLDQMAEPGGAGGESGTGAREGNALTPSQAKAQASTIEAQPGFRDGAHPQHKALVAERSRLLRIADGHAA